MHLSNRRLQYMNYIEQMWPGMADMPGIESTYEYEGATCTIQVSGL